MKHWEWLLALAALVYLVAAIASAAIETPTVDEFAHVPAGIVHWRQGRFDLYRNNPPLGKMWASAPLALDPSVHSPSFDGTGVGWQPWLQGIRFQDANPGRYLSLMVRARFMTIPLALLAATLIYFWSRSLFGRFAASMSASLFLLSPTILAHGHLATVDMAAALAIFAAVFSVRWAAAQPVWPRVLVAGGALGLALSLKFSALFLVFLLPPIFIYLSWPTAYSKTRLRTIACSLLLYAFSAWVVLNLTMAFRGTFDSFRSFQPRSKSIAQLIQWVPPSLPILVPRDYLGGVDALQEDIESGTFPAYLHGQWSETGWKSYYFVAFAIKESEPVVVLTLLSLIALFLVPISTRDRVLLLAPLAVFLVIATYFNSLFLGIRYMLPAFPLIFVAIGSVFSLVERWLTDPAASKQDSRGILRDRRLWIAAPIFAYAVVLPIAVFPRYISYFNQFVGGPSRGADWLIDSNLDWGQDLYRIPELARRLDAERIKLLYFGHVDPALYGINTEMPERKPDFGVYAVSVNFLRGLPYAVLDRNGVPLYVLDRIAWMADLVPTLWAGDSIAVFDLRDPSVVQPASDQAAYNIAVLLLQKRDPRRAADLLSQVVIQRPDWPEAGFYYGMALLQTGRPAPAMDEFRRVNRLRPDWPEPMNHLAWLLATSPQDPLRDGPQALALAEEACRLTQRKKLEYLDTLAAALAECGKFDQAVAVCREASAKAAAAGRNDIVQSFDRAIQQFQARQPMRDRP